MCNVLRYDVIMLCIVCCVRRAPGSTAPSRSVGLRLRVIYVLCSIILCYYYVIVLCIYVMYHVLCAALCAAGTRIYGVMQVGLRELYMRVIVYVCAHVVCVV